MAVVVTLGNASDAGSGQGDGLKSDGSSPNKPGGRLRVGPEIFGRFKGRNEFKLWEGEPDIDIEVMPRYDGSLKDFLDNPGKGWGGKFGVSDIQIQRFEGQRDRGV